MRMKRFYAVFVARNREFVRDTSALAWNILLPVLIVAGFAFAFSGTGNNIYKVGIYHNSNDMALIETSAPSLYQEFLQTNYIQFIPVHDLDKAVTKVGRHQLDMLLDADNNRYWLNSTSPRAYILERVLRGTMAGEMAVAPVKKEVTGDEIRYVDWLIPGVLGMNMMFSALFGVGYVIVRYRKSGVLKRLHGTPLTAFEFLAAQILSRLWLIIAITLVVYFGTDFFIDFAMYGSYFNLILTFTLGAMSMISLGLLVAARIASEELAGGMLNLLSWPMMFLSGVWFSLEGTQPMIQKLAEIFPLTHLIAASRAIMIDGASLLDVSYHLLVMAIMTVVFLLLGARLFKWE